LVPGSIGAVPSDGVTAGTVVTDPSPVTVSAGGSPGGPSSSHADTTITPAIRSPVTRADVRARDGRNVVALELTGVLLVRSVRVTGAPNWHATARLQFPDAERLKQLGRRCAGVCRGSARG
jgi:hypothetical protein